MNKKLSIKTTYKDGEIIIEANLKIGSEFYYVSGVYHYAQCHLENDMPIPIKKLKVNSLNFQESELVLNCLDSDSEGYSVLLPNEANRICFTKPDAIKLFSKMLDKELQKISKQEKQPETPFMHQT